MTFTSPFTKKKQPISQKLSNLIRVISHQETKREQRVRLILQALLYFSLFLSGYIVAKLQTLIVF